MNLEILKNYYNKCKKNSFKMMKFKKYKNLHKI